MGTEVSAGALAASLVVIVVLRLWTRAWTQRLEHSDQPDADKVHRLRRASTATSLVVLPALLARRLLAVVNGHAEHGQRHASAADGLGVLAVTVFLLGAAIAIGRPIRSSLERVRGADLKPQARGRRIGVASLFAVSFVVVVAVATALLPGRGAEAAIIRVAVIGVMLIAVQLLFAPVLLYSARAKAMPPEYAERFGHLAAEMHVKVAGFKIIPGGRQRNANALQIGAIPRYRFIAVTDYLMEHATDEQLDAVVAHELAHVAGHHVLKKMLLWTVTWLGLQAALLLIFHGGSGSAAYAAAPILILLALYLVQGAFGVRVERHADEAATREVGPDALVSALTLIGELNHSRMHTSRGWNLLTQHPGLDQRIEHARALTRSDSAAGAPQGEPGVLTSAR